MHAKGKVVLDSSSFLTRRELSSWLCEHRHGAAMHRPRLDRRPPACRPTLTPGTVLAQAMEGSDDVFVHKFTISLGGKTLFHDCKLSLAHGRRYGLVGARSLHETPYTARSDGPCSRRSLPTRRGHAAKIAPATLCPTYLSPPRQSRCAASADRPQRLR